jgi:hypothetical protein
LAASALAAGVAAVVLGVFGEDGSRTGGGRGGEGPTAAAFEGASCERFGRAALSASLRRPTNLRVGPITFVSLGDYARATASDFEPVGQALLREPWARRYVDDVVRREVRDRSLYVAQKVIVVVEGGRDVTVAIPRSERGDASLLWGPQPKVTRSENALGLRQISDGNPVVRFKGCDTKVMQYVGGGFVVAGKRCLPLDIWVDGREGPLRAVASFGAGARCSPRADVGLTQ